jgi:hypothetical protein
MTMHHLLTPLIGLRLSWHNRPYTVIDILAEGPTLILAAEDQPMVQPDQYGTPQRITPRTFALPLFTADGEWHPAVSGIVPSLAQLAARGEQQIAGEGVGVSAK